MVLLGGVFLFVWGRHRGSPALVWWGIPFMLTGLALALYTRPGWNTDFVSIAFGNAARMFSIGCLVQGVRVFGGRKVNLLPAVAVCVGWIALCFVPPIFASLLARIVCVSLMTSVLAALGAWELWRDRAEALASRWSAFAAFASFAILMAVRAAIAPWTPFPVGAQPLDAMWMAGFLWITFGHAVFGAVMFLGMIMGRREAEQRNFAMSDPLTGLMNRRAFADFAMRMSRRRAGFRSSLALLVLDLDHFKSVNDRFGHEVGDRMLRAFADVAENNVRPSDQLFRMGGEEFCFALPETPLLEAIAVAERIRKAFEATTIETTAGPARGTVSIGIAATQFAIDVDVLLAAADAAVYEAKARGRNRVVVAEPSSLVRLPTTERSLRLRA